VTTSEYLYIIVIIAIIISFAHTS